MKIKNLQIGKHCPPRIIAELGTLHFHQTDEEIIEVVGQCFEAGADMVKFQLIDPYWAWWADLAQLERYQNIDSKFNYTRYQNLFTTCSKMFEGPVFASVFSEKYLSLSMPAFKLGYKAVYDPYLFIQAVRTMQPLIVSSDANTRHHYPNHPRIKHLWCEPKYPMTCRLEAIPKTSEDGWQGFSLHTGNISFIEDVLKLHHPEILEVHVQGKNASGPDITFALTINQLKTLCKYNTIKDI